MLDQSCTCAFFGQQSFSSSGISALAHTDRKMVRIFFQSFN